MTVDYLLPMFKQTTHGLTCGCDMCYSEENQAPLQKIGPHDLHCLCFPCMSFCLNEKAYDEALEIRYPGYEAFDQTLSQDQVDLLWKDLDDSYYTSPSTSPTNADMHAYNGNLSHQHHHGNGDFLRAAGQHLSRVADRHRLPLMLGQAGLLPAGMLYSSMKNMAEPLAELREQVFGKTGPSNKEMHAYNGNFDVPGDSHGASRAPRIDNRKVDEAQKDRERNFKKPVKKQEPIVKKTERRKFQEPHVDHDVHYSKTQDPHHPNSNQPIGITAQLAELEHVNGVKGPSNKEMHATNGNIYVRAQGPMTKTEYERRQRKKAKKQFKKGKKGVNIQIKNTIAKSNNKKKNTKTHIEKIEKRIAKRYAQFLKQPSNPPPRIGSTGNMPTKLVHGYYKSTFSMAAPAFGVNTVTNATDLLVFICPKLFGVFTDPNDFYRPIGIGFATGANTAFNSNAGGGAGSNTFGSPDFLNYSALINECGTSSSNNGMPMARWLGGSVSLECRCPMSTTAPPYIYGGLLPEDYADNGATNGTRVKSNKQLNQLTSTEVRNLPSSKEVEGFEISAVYVPDTPNSLQFDGFCASSNVTSTTGSGMSVTAIPYVGMSGCPTTATVTITVSSWFEMQQTPNNALYAAGWSLGPKVSSEDVYDNLPRINPVSNRSINYGSKRAGFTLSSFIDNLHKPIPQPDVHLELSKLSSQLNKLKLLIEEEEDEKYISTSPPDTPVHHGLTQSTINLALALKDRITPGSVTSKTSKIQAA